ncbi:zona pellucida sperm-binding protein 3-like [Hyperolius riggenbachi]|uniref:zona pellucida sperm-binding protein 3-like n=1 Tax=Hyperolius riggenbachi TaxID=752182 RepID=UPI0035A3BF4B
MTPDWLIYSTNLTYSPTTARGVPIMRSSPAVVPIQCFYPRLGNVSSQAIKPTWSPFSTTVSSEERLSFSLRLMNDDWTGPRQFMFYNLGEVFNIEASVDATNHVDLILFVDRCVASTTVTQDFSSGPLYNIITTNGCLVDGTQDDASSAFRSPRIQPNKLQFSVDAFRFVEEDTSVIYITCDLRAAPLTQVPDPVNKACSYSKSTSSWSAVEGSSGICQCCNTGSCNPPGQSRVWGSSGRQRGLGKRDVAPQEHSQILLGPLLIAGTGSSASRQTGNSQASRKTAESRPVELWVLVAVASVSLVVVAVGVIAVGKCLLKRFSH